MPTRLWQYNERALLSSHAGRERCGGVNPSVRWTHRPAVKLPHLPARYGQRCGPFCSHYRASQDPPVDLRANQSEPVFALRERGLERPHLAGNSMGGATAIELARRGRAATVCALSPSGFWSAGDGLYAQVFTRVQRKTALGRFIRPLAPLMLKSATVRRFGLRDFACDGGRTSAARALAAADDGLASSVVADDFSASYAQMEPMDPLPCPITIAWSEKDAFLPMASYDKTVRERLPHATFNILPGVGQSANNRRPRSSGAHHPCRHRRGEEAAKRTESVGLRFGLRDRMDTGRSWVGDPTFCEQTDGHCSVV